MALTEYDYVLVKGDVWTETSIQRTPHKGRDWSDASTSQGTPKMASKLLEAGGEAGTQALSQPCPYLDLDVRSPELRDGRFLLF